MISNDVSVSTMQSATRKTVDSNAAAPKSMSKRGDGWLAQLILGFSDRGDKTVLKHRSQVGPLSVQRPLYPEKHICHVYLLHPPGGVVGGDELDIQVSAQSGCHALVTTPGATKFYRSDERIAVQTQHLVVEAGAVLEWLPQENIFFPDSHAKVNSRIDLHGDAQFMGWEIHCFGRPALNETFSLGQLRGKTEIFHDGQRLLTEQLKLDGGDTLFLRSGLQSFPMVASFYISNGLNICDDLALFEHLQTFIADLQHETLVLGITHIERLIVVRALGHWSEEIIHAFGLVWQQVRIHSTGRKPDLPRIWAT